MNKWISLWLVILILSLVACNLTPLQTKIVPSTTPLRPTPVEAASPTATQLPPTRTISPSPTPLPITPTPPAPSALPIVYYYFVATTGKPAPAGSVVILPEILILGPTLSNIARSPDPLTNINSALQAMIRDPRNAWSSDDLSIARITLKDGAAQVALQGKLFGAGDIVLIAARMQILLTVFAEATVQSATVTLNGANIANLGISRSSEAKPADFGYTRAEIEAFMVENAYQNP